MLGAGRNSFMYNGANSEEEKMFLVTELAENGELFDFVQNTGGFNQDKTPFARALFSQVA